MLIEPFYVDLGNFLDDLMHSPHLQVSMDVAVADVPKSICNVSQYFVLKYLTQLFGILPNLNTTIHV